MVSKKRKSIKKKMDIQTKQLVIVVSFILFVFLLFFGIYFGIKFSNNFSYLNLKWDIQKDKIVSSKGVTFYHTIFPKIYNKQYYGDHNLYLRYNPRENDILVDVEGFSFSKNIIYTSDPSIRKCSRANLAFYALGDITVGLPFIKSVRDGSIDKDNIPEGMIYADCLNSSINTTIVKIIYGNETKIYQDSLFANCYIIELSDCSENLKASERFVLKILEDLNF